VIEKGGNAGQVLTIQNWDLTRTGIPGRDTGETIKRVAGACQPSVRALGNKFQAGRKGDE